MKLQDHHLTQLLTDTEALFVSMAGCDMGASYGLTACAHLQSRVPGPCWPKNSHLFVCLHVSGLAVLPLEPTHSLNYSFIHPLHPTHASRSVRAPPRKPARIDPDDCDRQRGPSLCHPPVCKNRSISVELRSSPLLLSTASLCCDRPIRSQQATITAERVR